LLDYQNNKEHSNVKNNAASFDNLVINLSVLHNYFDEVTKLFLNLYLVKFLDILVKLFFPHKK